jgi:exodeoxyribonuclease VII small subunit
MPKANKPRSGAIVEVAAMTEQTEIETMSFEAAMRRLEETVEQLEGGEHGLDGALARYELGVRILKRCYGLLDAAERTVALLTGVDTDGQPLTSPFDATATAERGAPFEARRDARSWPGAPKPVASESADLDLPPF